MAKQDACLFSWLGVNWETNTGKKGAVLRAYVGTKTRKGKISAEQKWHHVLLNTYWSEGNSPIFIRLTDLENSPYCSIKPRLSQILRPKEKFWLVPLCPRECQFVINHVKSLPLALGLLSSESHWLAPGAADSRRWAKRPLHPARHRKLSPLWSHVWLLTAQSAFIEKGLTLQKASLLHARTKRSCFGHCGHSWASAPSTKLLSSLLARTLALHFDGPSGFRVNGSPTQTFPWWLSTDTLNKLRSKFPFTWLFTSIKYLGVHLSHWTSDPLKLNYPPLVNQIKKKDLVKQNNLSLSWFSWLSTIKMNALPHVNYFLEVLPVLLPLSYL